MSTVNIFQAKTQLSKLVEAVESGAEAEIIIARNGKPAARLVPIETKKAKKRIGVAKWEFDIPPPDPAFDAEIAALFYGDGEIDPPEIRSRKSRRKP